MWYSSTYRDIEIYFDNKYFCHSITVADSVWKFINSPIIAIFSDLENPATEQMICSLLESLLKRSSTLTTILVPPFNNDIPDQTLQQQYAGSLFIYWSNISLKIRKCFVFIYIFVIYSIYNMVIWHNVSFDLCAIKCDSFKQYWSTSLYAQNII